MVDYQGVRALLRLQMIALGEADADVLLRYSASAWSR
jgi:hypothetical protein